jgi:hypothetical protein
MYWSTGMVVIAMFTTRSAFPHEGFIVPDTAIKGLVESEDWL